MESLTPRLIGRRPTRDDADLLFALLNDPGVARTMAGTRTREQVADILDRHCRKWEQYGFGLHLLFDAATGDFVGRGGLQRVDVLGHEETEIGYALLPAYWGRGLATELGRASVDRAFTELGADSVVGFTWVENVASRRVLEKCGLVLEQEFEHFGLAHVFLRVRRDQRPVG